MTGDQIAHPLPDINIRREMAAKTLTFVLSLLPEVTATRRMCNEVLSNSFDALIICFLKILLQDLEPALYTDFRGLLNEPLPRLGKPPIFQQQIQHNLDYARVGVCYY